MGAYSLSSFSAVPEPQSPLISQETTERIKQATRIEDVVGEFVPLKRRGSRLIGLCPFHQEKTPSFNVNIPRNSYKCFGCGKGGDAIDFLQEHEHLTYPEALRWLAARYQIEIEEKESTPEQKAAHDHQESLMIVNQFAAAWFARQMLETDAGRAIGLSYFQERGLRQESLETFSLGWCPDHGDRFTQAALEASYQLAFLEELGLTKSKEGRHWDFYRGRAIFPIHNPSGKVIGFGARALKTGPGIPKYVNSPESVIYNKSAVLYGMFQARRAIAEQDLAYLVEGYTDVISLHQAGIRNAVASSGTALTSGQLRLIRRYTPNVTLLYDGDPAGLKAALRGTEIALEEGLNVRIVRLPAGEDPDSLVQQLGGEGMRQYLETEARDFVLFKTDLLLQEAEGDPIKKAALAREVIGTIAKVSDPIARSLYLRQTAALLDMPEQLLILETNKAVQQGLRKQQESERRQQQSGGASGTSGFRGERSDYGERGSAPGYPAAAGPEEPLPQHDLQQTEPQGPSTPPGEHRERDLIRLLLEADAYQVEEQPAIAFILEQISDVELSNPLYAAFLDEYWTMFKSGNFQPSRYFLEHEKREFKELALTVLHQPWELSQNWLDKHDIAITDKQFLIPNDIKKVLARLKSTAIQGMMAERHQRMLSAENDEEVRQLQYEFNQLRIIDSEILKNAGFFLIQSKGGK